MNQLFVTLSKLSQLQGQAMDRLALQAAVQELDPQGAEPHGADPRATIATLLSTLQLPAARWTEGAALDPVLLPGLLFCPGRGWGLLRARNARAQWVCEWFDEAQSAWVEDARADLSGCQFARLTLARPFEAARSPVFRLIRDTILQQRSALTELVLGGTMINLVALATSLYSMQVYDRVVPTGATQTLLVLTLGALIAILFELLVKRVRSNLNERMVDRIDSQLARAIYSRFLAVRLDQMPGSVGGLAGQLKGYETVRAFLAAVPAQLLTDMPFVLIYTLVVGAVAGWIALIPFGFALASATLGLVYRQRVEALTRKANQASNLKTGLLVETIEGAETIKSGQGGWRMLARWLHTTDEARVSELEMRQVAEHSQYWIATLHQISYVMMVAAGALIIARGELSMGGLIACSILSGRILAPIGTLPGMLIQWGHCRAALQGLDRIWQLQDDHHGIDHPLSLESISGAYQFDQVELTYGQNRALTIPRLHIQPGEKIGVLGPVGSGKTTLLRLLGGLYRPQKGTIRLDGVDLSHIAKPVLAEQIGYLQQEGRLFAGTLRDNLILGLIDPGDQAILEAAELTGLQQAVLVQHPQGLQQPIFEGGTGLSGGQRQLTNLTRVFLRKPRIWLLDEPTASMDRNLEIRIMQALARRVGPEDTLVLVTHKPEMLQLVDRLIVVAGHQVVLDGPKAEVLQRLQNPTPQPAAAPSLQTARIA